MITWFKPSEKLPNIDDMIGVLIFEPALEILICFEMNTRKDFNLLGSVENNRVYWTYAANLNLPKE